ncbi:MAG: tetratricopeptide repeat protein [Bacteriovoracaceae bacterium]|nr:tetratricopeptide repeat protein [Bacteriovoracaceae bacterium]
MKKLAVIGLICVLSVLLSSCSTTPSRKSEVTSVDKSQKKRPLRGDEREQFLQSLEVAEEKLKKLSDQIIKRNDKDEIRFYASDLYLKATDASMRGDSYTAAILYKYVMKLSGGENYVKRKYAVELIRIGELKSALPILDGIYKDSKRKDETIGLILAGVYTALNNHRSARGIYEKILKKNPKSQKACIFLAKSYSHENRFKKMNGILSNCEKRIKGDASFAYYKGKIAVSRKKRRKAIRHFKRALGIDPGFTQAAVALGLMYEEKEQYRKAEKIYENFLKKNPREYTVLSRMVQILFLEGKSKKIIPYVEKLSSLDSSDLNTKVKLGILYTDVKRYRDAKGVFKEILHVVPDSDKVLYYLGSLCKEVDEFEEAIGYYNMIRPESPLFRSGNNEIAKILFVRTIRSKKGEDKSSEVEKFVNFIEEKTKKYKVLRLDLQYNLASFYEANRDYLSAIRIITSLINEKEFSEDHDYYLASLYEKNKNFENARKIIHRILKKNPKNADALNFLGYSYLENEGDFTKAWKYIEKASNLKPKDGYIQDSLGWYYYKKGEMKKALKKLKSAQKAVKDDVVINQHLAIVYQKLKVYHKARKFYLEALKNCRKDSEIRDQVIRSLEDLKKIRLPASRK